jgi:hypothetical protein
MRNYLGEISVDALLSGAGFIVADAAVETENAIRILREKAEVYKTSGDESSAGKFEDVANGLDKIGQLSDELYRSYREDKASDKLDLTESEKYRRRLFKEFDEELCKVKELINELCARDLL